MPRNSGRTLLSLDSWIIIRSMYTIVFFDVPPIRWQSPPKTIIALVEDPKLNHKFQVSLGRRSIPDNIPYHLPFASSFSGKILKNDVWYCWWFRNPKANHLGCIPKPVQIMGSTTNLNWLYSRISEPSTVTLDIEGDTSGGIGSDNLTCRPSRFRRMPQPPKWWEELYQLYLIPWFMTGFYRKFKSIYIYKCVYLKKCIYIYTTYP